MANTECGAAGFASAAQSSGNVVRSRQAGGTVAAAASDTCRTMLDVAEPVQGAHALVVCHPGIGGLDMLCGLLGRGCEAATELPPDARGRMEPAEIVLVPNVTTLDTANLAIAMARRSLLPCGRIVLRDATGLLATGISRLLHAAGFSFVRVRALAGGNIVSADWPWFPPLSKEAGRA